MARKSEAPKKKKTPARKGIKLEMDLGPIKATPEQIARLKAYLGNQVVTWVTADLKGKSSPPIVFEEFPRPLPPGDDE